MNELLEKASRTRTHPETRLWANSTLENKDVSEPTEGFRTDSSIYHR